MQMRNDTTPTIPDCRLECLEPLGLMLQANQDNASLQQLPLEELRQLVLKERLLVLRGFQPFADKDSLTEYCRTWGELLEWDFGHVFEVVEHEDPKNYLFTSGSVPYHWDGAFADRTPWLQFFQCVQAPGTAHGGETIFCDTVKVWQSAAEATRQQWQNVTIAYSTQKVAHYGGEIRVPLIGTHPLTQEKTIRFAEPANKDTVQLNTPELAVEGIPEDQREDFLRDLIGRVYREEFVNAHVWQSGDFVIADNHALLHGRTPYGKKLPRKLWRVHIL